MEWVARQRQRHAPEASTCAERLNAMHRTGPSCALCRTHSALALALTCGAGAGASASAATQSDLSREPDASSRSLADTARQLTASLCSL